LGTFSLGSDVELDLACRREPLRGTVEGEAGVFNLDGVVGLAGAMLLEEAVTVLRLVDAFDSISDFCTDVEALPRPEDLGLGVETLDDFAS